MKIKALPGDDQIYDGTQDLRPSVTGNVTYDSWSPPKRIPAQVLALPVVVALVGAGYELLAVRSAKPNPMEGDPAELLFLGPDHTTQVITVGNHKRNDTRWTKVDFDKHGLVNLSVHFTRKGFEAHRASGGGVSEPMRQFLERDIPKPITVGEARQRLYEQDLELKELYRISSVDEPWFLWDIV